MKTVLIIGGGFIGLNLAELLVKKNNKVVVFDRKANANLKTKIIFEQGEFKERNFDKIIRNYNVNIVIHCLSSIIPSSDKNQYLYDIENVYVPTVSLIKICSKHNIKFVFISSGGTIYGKYNGKVKENKSSRPINYYGLSKLNIEELIYFESRNYGLNYLILRPSNPYGFGQNIFGKQGLIAVTIGNISHGREMTIFGDGSSIRDYIYIDDFSEIVITLISKNINNKVLNIGTGNGHTISEVISIVEDKLSINGRITFYNKRECDIDSMLLDNKKLKALMPEISFTNLKSGIEQFINKLQCNGNLK